MRTLAGYLTHAIEEFPVDPKTIYEMVVVGNSTMRDLFFRQNVYSIGQNPYRSITEIEMAEGKRTTTSLTQTGRRSAAADSPEGPRLRRADHQRPRRRRRRGVHARDRPRARRSARRDHGHRHQHGADRRQQAPHPRRVVPRRAGVRRRRDRLRHAGARRRDRRRAICDDDGTFEHRRDRRRRAARASAARAWSI